jgi:hypothetical protein
VGAPYASDAPSQSMVGSLRSWLERSRNEPTRPHRLRTRWRPPEPPTAESSHSPPGSRRPNARSSQPWLLPLRQRRVLPQSGLAGPPRRQSPRPPPRNDRLAGRARTQPHRQPPRSDQLAGRPRPQPQRRRPSEQSGGPGSPQQPQPSAQSAGLASPWQRPRPPSGPSADPGRTPPRQLQRPPSDRSDGPGLIPSRMPHRHRVRPTEAVG